MSNALGVAACCCGLLARCNHRLEGYDPVLLMFDLGLGELAKIYLKKEFAFLGYLLHFICQLFNSESDVLDLLLVEEPTKIVMESEVLLYPL